MLKLINGTEAEVVNVDDFYIKEESDGLDELIFNISIYDPIYPKILEEAIIEYEQQYLIKAIDAGSSTAKVKCQINIDAFKNQMYLNYTNDSATLVETINALLPDAWQFLDESGSTIRRTIEGNYTALEIIEECAETYNVNFRYDTKLKQLKAVNPDSYKPMGAFATRELNLKEINYKGKSTDFYTRLYAYGKDGLSIADINDGKPYVENLKYSDKIISKYWKDERYEVAENLKEAAQKAVDSAGIPERSYECSVYDIAATNPEMYKFQDFSLFNVITLIDDIKNISVNYQVVEYWRYPFYPEKNTVTLSSVAPKIQNSVKNIQIEINNPNSSFNTNIQNLINELGRQISGENGGNMIITQNEEGQPNGIMIMDTADKATAKKILWLNLSGIAYSDTGVNGDFSSVWSFEKSGFIADWLVAGTINAINIIGSYISGSTLHFGSDTTKTVDVSGNSSGVLFKGNGNITMRTQAVYSAENYVANSNYETLSNRIYLTDGTSSNGAWIYNRNTETAKEANHIHLYKNKNGGTSGIEINNYEHDGSKSNRVLMEGTGSQNNIYIENAIIGSDTLKNQLKLSSNNSGGGTIGMYQFDSSGATGGRIYITDNEAYLGNANGCLWYTSAGNLCIKTNGQGAYKIGFKNIDGTLVLCAV